MSKFFEIEDRGLESSVHKMLQCTMRLSLNSIYKSIKCMGEGLEYRG